MSQESTLARANNAFRAGKYQEAIDLYQLCINENPRLTASISFNLKLAKEKLLGVPPVAINKNQNERKKIVIYTCNFGGFESVKEPQVIDLDVDYIIFTDNPHLKTKNWKVVVINELQGNHRRASRLAKLLPHRYLPDHEVSIYIDSSITLTVTNILKVAQECLQKNDIAAYQHSKRNCTYTELDECVKLGKANPAKVESLRQYFEKDGFPKNYGLLENAFLIRRNTDSIRKLNEEWHSFFTEGEERDQFYLMYLLWKRKLQFSTITNSKDFRKSPYLQFTSHTTKSTLTKPNVKKRFAVAVHVYYEEMWPMLVNYLKNMKGKVDIFVSCRTEIYENLSYEVQKSFPEAEVVAIENLGMDVLPFLRLCKERQLFLYDAVLKLHTKNQKSVERASQGKILLDGLCGHTKLTQNILDAFENDPNLGMVGTAFQIRSTKTLMYGNRDNVQNILNCIDVNLDDWPLFCGTMFWISGHLLTPLVEQLDELIVMCQSDTLIKTGGDGTTAHALERIFGALPLASNKQIYVTERVNPDQDDYLLLPLHQHGPCNNPRYIETTSTSLIARTTKAKSDYEIIKKQGDFDSKYYSSQLGGNLVSGMDPLYHFILYGDLLGISPSAHFNVNFYIISRPDIERKNICTYSHYLTKGRSEGVIPNPTEMDWLRLAEKCRLFNPNWYLKENLSTIQIGDAYQHYLSTGAKEGYSAGPNFHPKSIPVMQGNSLFKVNGCASFLEYYYRDEAHLYEVITRATTHGDDYLIADFLYQLKSTFGETRATLEAIGNYFILVGDWNKALAYLSKFWSDYKKASFSERHRKSIVKYDRPVRSDNNKFPLSKLSFNGDLPQILGNKICIYTTLFGGIDDLLPIIYPVDGVDYICFTDKKRDTKGWKQVIVNPGMPNNNLNAKIYKVLPHKYLADYDYSLFVDANTLFLGKTNQLLRLCISNGDFVMWQHPFREDVYLEGGAIVGFVRHEPTKIIEQLKTYSENGLPHSTGLLEASYIWRRHGAVDVIKLMENWWAEINQHSSRDQLSLGYLVWRDKFKPKILPDILGTSRSNDYFVKISHKHRKNLDERQSPPKKINLMRQRDIAFIYADKYRQAGSTVMRGEQLSSMLRNHYQGKRNVVYTNKTNITGQIIVLTKGFLKQATPELIHKLAKSNYVIADFVDEPPSIDLVNSVDALMASSLCGYRDYLGKFSDKAAFHVTHHVDIRLAKHIKIPQGDFRAAYFGELVNTVRDELIDQYVSFNLVDTSTKSDSWIDELQNYNFHYATRRVRGIDGAKPFLKGFIAAHCGANMMIQKSAGDARYYLGHDYPYLLPEDATPTEILAALEVARESFGSATWRYGLEIMQEVKARSCEQHVLLEFERMLQAI